MHRSSLHSLFALVVSVLLLAQYVPTDHLRDGGKHEHCIHCNGSYCTMEGCECGHAHRRAAADRGTEGHPLPSASHLADATHRSHSNKSGAQAREITRDPTGAHSHENSRDISDATAGSAADSHGDAAGYDVTIEPCGSAPAALLLPTLDKFIADGSDLSTPLGRDNPSGSVYVPFHHQLFVEDIFRPPIPGLV